MCENDAVETRECFRETDVQIGLEVPACPVKDIMRRFVNDENDIPRLLIWLLVCFVRQDDPVSLSGTAGNVEFDYVLTVNDLLALALLAAVLLGYDLAGPLASAARNSFLCYQARAYLSENVLLTCSSSACTDAGHSRLLTSSSTLAALMRLCTFFSTASLALVAHNLFRVCEPGGFALVQLF